MFRITSPVWFLLSFPLLACQVDRLRSLGVVLCYFSCISAFMPCLQAVPARAPLGLVWQADLAGLGSYHQEVGALLTTYETSVGQVLEPADRGKVGLKVNTRGGRGLSTPLPLLRAMIAALEQRGYSRDTILIVDHSAYSLRQAGILPPLSEPGETFEGCPVIALDSNLYYEDDWFYDSPLPSAMQQDSNLLFGSDQQINLKEGNRERKSFLPAPLLFDVDFWINLAVGVDDPSLGIDGVLANVTLWNVSNSRRFLVNQATASAAVAEIAAIPELQERLILNFVSLDHYQFIAGPFFNSLYTRSEPLLWMSSDPVALDRLLYDRFNDIRRLQGFPEIQPIPRQLPFAASLGLGVYQQSQIQIDAIVVERTAPQDSPEIINTQERNALN